MSNMKDLFETIISMSATVSAKAASEGGKVTALAAARKIGWASSSAGGGGGIRGHSIVGHKMASGFGKRRGLGNYDPKTEYSQSQKALYESAMLSGSGFSTRPIGYSKKTSLAGLSRGHQITKYQHQAKPKPNSAAGKKSPLKNSVLMGGVKF